MTFVGGVCLWGVGFFIRGSIIKGGRLIWNAVRQWPSPTRHDLRQYKQRTINQSINQYQHVSNEGNVKTTKRKCGSSNRMTYVQTRLKVYRALFSEYTLRFGVPFGGFLDKVASERWLRPVPCNTNGGCPMKPLGDPHMMACIDCHKNCQATDRRQGTAGPLPKQLSAYE